MASCFAAGGLMELFTLHILRSFGIWGYQYSPYWRPQTLQQSPQWQYILFAEVTEDLQILNKQVWWVPCGCHDVYCGYITWQFNRKPLNKHDDGKTPGSQRSTVLRLSGLKRLIKMTSLVYWNQQPTDITVCGDQVVSTSWCWLTSGAHWSMADGRVGEICRARPICVLPASSGCRAEINRY